MSETNRSTHDRITEYGKNLVEYLKHLTTLSTGSIVLQIAFLEKVFPHPRWKVALLVSLLSFTLSIISSVVVYTLVLLDSLEPNRESLFASSEWRGNVGASGILITWLGFLLGIIFLVIFALRNLFAL